MSVRLRLLALGFVAFGLVAGPVANAKTPPTATVAKAVRPASVGFDSERLKKLDTAMAKVVADGQVAGMTTLLVRHGKTVAVNSYGVNSLETNVAMSESSIVRIYSMSKPLTGVAMMILFEEGKWSLDDPITKFIPELKNLTVSTGVDDKGQMITVPVTRPPTMRELMSHTAGFGYGLGNTDPVDKMFRSQKVFEATGLKDMVNRVAKVPLKSQPGTKWSYSIAVDLQGYIVEKLSGQSFGDFLQARVFGPLKMNDTGFSTGPDKASRLAEVYLAHPITGKLVTSQSLGSPGQDYTVPPKLEAGGSGLVSTAADYGRFAQMILNGGELDGVRILAPATVSLMGTNVIPDSVLVDSNGIGGARFNSAVGFGLDFAVVNDPRKAGILGGKGELSWGGLAGTWFWIDPTNDLYFIGMIQRFGGVSGDDLSGRTRSLVYQALTHPEK